MDPRVRHILDCLDSNSGAPLRVKALAARVGLSVSRLEHLFRSHMQTNLREYVNRQRLLRAARELRGSSERISTIAFDAGFTDACNFSHAFKRFFGVSPRVYRRGYDRDLSDPHAPQQLPPINSDNDQEFADPRQLSLWQYWASYPGGIGAMAETQSDISLTPEDALRLATFDTAFKVALTLHPEQFKVLFSLGDVDAQRLPDGRPNGGQPAAQRQAVDPDRLTVADALRLARADQVFGASLFSYPEEFRDGFNLTDSEIAALGSVPETSTIEDGVAEAASKLGISLEPEGATLTSDDGLRLAQRDDRFRAAFLRDPARFKQTFNLSDEDVRRITEALRSKS